MRGGRIMEAIGLQLWSVKEEIEKDLLGTLEKVARMGYKGVQFAGFFNHSAKDVKAKMDELGIHPMGAHVQIDLLQNELEQTLRYHEEIGNDIIIVPWLQEKMRESAEDYKWHANIIDISSMKLNE